VFAGQPPKQFDGAEMPTTKGMTRSYNRDSRTQHEDFIHSLGTLLECIDATVAEGVKRYSIIDYGCSLGANSVLAMKRLIEYLHERKSINSFSAYHNDLPTNDFNALLKNLSSSTHDYRHISGCQVFIQLVPTSFFQQIVPEQWVDLGFSVAAVHWLNRIPVSDYKNGVFLSDVNQQARADLLAQAATDLRLFAKGRSKEIKPGGLLFIVGLASKVDPVGCREVSTAGLFVVVKKVLTGLVADRLLSQEALDNFVFPVVPRAEEEFLKPFMTGELSGDWRCLHCSIEDGIPTDYVAYQKHRDAKQYAADYTRFFRSFSQVAMLENLFSHGALTMSAVELCDAFYTRFCQAIETSPEEGVFHHTVSSIVMQRH
jgi:indole-3-acetate O-methyltransferase